MNTLLSPLRPTFRAFLFGICLVAAGGCQKHLGPYLEKAQKTFAEKNYVDSIDSINSGLNYWQESEGADKKAQAYELLGKSHRALRNADKALDAYQQAAKISPDRFDVYFDMANIYLTKGFADQAERNFREALRVKPDDPLALLGLGNSLFTQKKTDEAAEAFQRILDTSPGVKDAMESLAAINRPARKPAVKAISKAAVKPKKTKPAPSKTHRAKRK